jgi:protein required for attachment to host cells
VNALDLDQTMSKEEEMILANGTLVAVTDGEKLRLFRNNGHEPQIDLVELHEPGLHVANTGSGGRHRSSTANPDDSRLREDDFAAAVAGYLNREALTDAFEHLVLIADPRTLGELRKHFQASLKAKVVGELGKDLVKHPIEAIESTLATA